MLHSTQRNAQTVLCVWDYQACCSCFDFALCTLLISWPQACFWPGLCFMFRICLPAFRSECFIAIASVPAFSHTTVMLLSFFTLICIPSQRLEAWRGKTFMIPNPPLAVKKPHSHERQVTCLNLTCHLIIIVIVVVHTISQCTGISFIINTSTRISRNYQV